GAYQPFAKAIRFSYTHTAANDLNGAQPPANATYTLEWDGMYLYGIPWTNIGTKQNPDFVPQFSLKAGVQISDNAGKQYVVKPLLIQQRMRKNPGGCTGLTLTQAGNLPWLAAADVGAMPAYLQWNQAPLAWNTKPRVVEGVVLF
ncbi:MAG: hypothetical protein D6771_07380, partial [Zetaproteobacteria bacterium]